MSPELFDKWAVTVAGATAEFGFGRTFLYELMGSGRLPFSQVNGRRLIPRKALADLLAANVRGAGTASGEVRG